MGELDYKSNFSIISYNSSNEKHQNWVVYKKWKYKTYYYIQNSTVRESNSVDEEMGVGRMVHDKISLTKIIIPLGAPPCLFLSLLTTL